MSENTSEVALSEAPRDVAVMPGFNSAGGWALAQRIGRAFAESTLVPQAYQGNLANCIVALEMANRMGASPLMVMQNLYIVHGNPGWSAKFLVACFNQCGRFSSLRYEFNEARTSCRAWAIEKASGERIDGPLVTIEMAGKEGWSTKSGSKWKTMPELMLMYRSAAFLIRTYAPEISMGLQTDDEMQDIGPEYAEPAAGKPPVRMPTARRAALPATVIDEETGEIEPLAEDETPAPAATPAATATPAAQAKTTTTATTATAGNAASLATAGERQFIVNRCKSNGLDLAEMLAKHEVASLETMSTDQFIAIKDELPKSV